MNEREHRKVVMNIPMLDGLELVVLKLIGTRPLILQGTVGCEHLQAPRAAVRCDFIPANAGLYRLPDALGGLHSIPAAYFKQSVVESCRLGPRSMGSVVGSLHVAGVTAWRLLEVPSEPRGRKTHIASGPLNLVPIIGQPTMRADVVRIGDGGETTDLRFRPQYTEWCAVVPVQFVKKEWIVAQIIDAFRMAGFYCGIGMWRPGLRKGGNGTYGMWKLAESDEELTSFEGYEPTIIQQPVASPLAAAEGRDEAA
jgi:hypothetical protein